MTTNVLERSERSYSPLQEETREYTLAQMPAELTGIRGLQIESPSPFRVKINGRETIHARSVYIAHSGPLTVEKRPRFLRGNSVKVYGEERNPQLETLSNPQTVGRTRVFYDPDRTVIDGKEFRNLDYLEITGLSNGAEIVAKS